MKQLVTLLFAFCIMTVQAQTDKIKYQSGEIYLVAQDAKTNKIAFERPYGKILSIEYDKFYKSYYILFEMPEGATGFGLNYIRPTKNGAILMQDQKKSEDFYYVYDKINESDTLILVSTQKVEGFIMSYKIINIK